MKDEYSIHLVVIAIISFLTLFLLVQSCEIHALRTANIRQNELIIDLEHDLLIQTIIRERREK